MNNRNSAPVILLVLLGIAFVAVAIFYAVTNTSFLASSTGIHYKHAIVAAILAVLCFVGANFARNRAA